MKVCFNFIAILICAFALGACKKSGDKCCFVGPSNLIEMSVADSAGNDLLANANSPILSDTIYYTNYIYNFYADGSFLMTTTKYTAKDLQANWLLTNSYGQHILRLQLNVNGRTVLQFGKYKKDTINAVFNKTRADKIYVNSVVKYDDSKPAHEGEPWFTLVK